MWGLSNDEAGMLIFFALSAVYIVGVIVIVVLDIFWPGDPPDGW